MSNVILYVPPGNCVQCARTKALLDREGVTYQVRLVTDYPEEVDRLKALVGSTAPLVVAYGRSWSGFRYDLLMGLPRG
ncbi:glutaredoxin family protein [Falsigemmobacter faecalis]|uniref:Glutaredoxin family protein n=1 Tax=Falsigemmobacter faecalis TaxID=2488730 RepID=A0A3P3DCB2_9RHOB|nr:glutaredoxin family protein [Falsigemmobacter faecalis]RRH70038.1 glutaredoxin family protein [Falsigemmobacter faecalis]